MFQRSYSAVSASSPSSENRANLRRSVRDDPEPHPARLRKSRHGWTLQFGRPLNGANCTKSLVLLLIVVLTLLGIGGIALYIVFGEFYDFHCFIIVADELDTRRVLLH